MIHVPGYGDHVVKRGDVVGGLDFQPFHGEMTFWGTESQHGEVRRYTKTFYRNACAVCAIKALEGYESAPIRTIEHETSYCPHFRYFACQTLQLYWIWCKCKNIATPQARIHTVFVARHQAALDERWNRDNRELPTEDDDQDSDHVRREAYGTHV